MRKKQETYVANKVFNNILEDQTGTILPVDSKAMEKKFRSIFLQHENIFVYYIFWLVFNETQMCCKKIQHRYPNIKYSPLQDLHNNVVSEMDGRDNLL